MTINFDYCISNPPYQESVKSKHNNNTAINIFQHFYTNGLKIASKEIMIFPGGRWMQRSIKNDSIADLIFSTCSTIDWYSNTGEQTIFDNIFISDGLSIVSAENNNTNNNILLNGETRLRPGNKEILPLRKESVPIIEKIFEKHKSSIDERKLSSKFFGLRTFWVEKNFGNDKIICSINNIPENINKPIKAFLGNEKAGIGKRVEEYWVDKNIIEWNENKKNVYESWKIVATDAGIVKNPSTTKYFIVDNEHIIGESWKIVANFKKKEQAENFLKYLQTKFSKYLLYESRGGKNKTWGYFIPDLVDYSNDNPIFTPNDDLPDNHEYKNLDLDDRLCKYFGFVKNNERVFKND